MDFLKRISKESKLRAIGIATVLLGVGLHAMLPAVSVVGIVIAGAGVCVYAYGAILDYMKKKKSD